MIILMNNNNTHTVHTTNKQNNKSPSRAHCPLSHSFFTLDHFIEDIWEQKTAIITWMTSLSQSQQTIKTLELFVCLSI